MQPSGSVQPLDVTGGNQVEIGASGDDLLFTGDEFRGAVPAIALSRYAAIGFDDLPVVGIPAKGPLNKLPYRL